MAVDAVSSGRLYSFVSYVYGIMGILATALGAWHTLGGSFDLTVQIVSMSSILCYVISALIHGEIVLITVVMLQYGSAPLWVSTKTNGWLLTCSFVAQVHLHASDAG